MHSSRFNFEFSKICHSTYYSVSSCDNFDFLPEAIVADAITAAHTIAAAAASSSAFGRSNSSTAIKPLPPIALIILPPAKTYSAPTTKQVCTSVEIKAVSAAETVFGTCGTRDKSRHKIHAATARSARGKTETAGLTKSGSSAPVGVIAARIKLNTPNTVPTAIPEARADAPPVSMTASKTGICITVIDAFGPSGIMPR